MATQVAVTEGDSASTLDRVVGDAQDIDVETQSSSDSSVSSSRLVSEGAVCEDGVDDSAAILDIVDGVAQDNPASFASPVLAFVSVPPASFASPVLAFVSVPAASIEVAVAITPSRYTVHCLQRTRSGSFGVEHTWQDHES